MAFSEPQSFFGGTTMADEVKDDSAIGIEDVLPVRSRISWGAILAGSVIALATTLVLGLLGSAIGLTVNADVERETLSAGAALWGMISTIVAMFLAGWVTCLCAVGETKREAIIHGVITWGVVLAMGLWLVAMGVGAGFDAMTGLAVASDGLADGGDWTVAARRAGVSQESIDQWRNSNQPNAAAANQPVPDARDVRRAEEAATSLTWWTLAGTLLSLASAIGGALVGAGPSFALLKDQTGTTYVVREGRYRNAI
jgi:hypothetical protein